MCGVCWANAGYLDRLGKAAYKYDNGHKDL